MVHEERTTAGLVLFLQDTQESAAVATVFTRQFGLVRALAMGLRKPSSKLMYSLQPGMFIDLTMVYGKAGWRLIGAVEKEHAYFSGSTAIDQSQHQLLIFKIIDGLRRFVHGDAPEPLLFDRIFALCTRVLDKQRKSGKTVLDDDEMDMLVSTIILSSLGYLSSTLPASADDDFFAGVYTLIRRRPKELKKAVTEAAAGSHL